LYFTGFTFLLESEGIMKILFKVFTGLFFCFGLAAAVEAAQVEQFSPQGTVKEIRQVTARFSEAMVPFGDPRLQDPFSPQCPEKGKGRWVDGRTWVYDFERDFPAGVICTFQLKPDLKTLAGGPVRGPEVFSFNTGGPSVRRSKPEEGHNGIDENQVFIFSLDSEADEASITRGAYCLVEGIQERVGIRLLKREEQEQLFKDLKMKKEKSPAVAFQCRRTFPPGAEVKIVWGKGIKALSNLPTVEDQTLVFKTRQPFYARFRGKREKPTSGCIPLLPMKLVFSAPVSWETARQVRLISQTGKIWKPQPGGEDHNPLVDWIVFEGPFPENTSFALHLPKNLKDDAGRPLSNQGQFPLKIKTDRYPSLAKFSARFGIIEWKEGGVLPLTVRNLEAEIKAWRTSSEDKPTRPTEKMAEKSSASGSPERALIRPLVPETGKGIPDPGTRSLSGRRQHLGIDQQEKIIEWLKILKTARRDQSILKGKEGLQKISIPKQGSPNELEVIGIPLKEPGFHLLELESEILGSRLLNKLLPMYVPAAALVTNLAAHFKWGRASSLVWVTTLDQGEPVPGAEVTIRDCNGKKHWQGKTDENGVARIGAALPSGKNLPRCADKREEEEYWPPLSGIQSGLFAFARTEKDLTFTHSGWDEGIESWRFNIPSGNFTEKEDFLAHTVFDRTLFRAGEEVHMKHFLRKPGMKGLFLPSQMEGINEIVIEHARSNQQYVFPLKWRPNGSAETVFRIPENAKLGTYEVSLASKSKQPKVRFDQKMESGSFRVEEFRVPLMKAFIQGPKDPLIKTREVELDLSVRYLSGGGAAHLPVKVRTEIQPRFVTFPDYEDFVFSNGKIKPGVIRPREYDQEHDEGFDEAQEAENRSLIKKEKLHSLDLTLDQQGVLRTRLPGIPEIDSPRDFLTELEFRDPNGEIQTVSSRIPLYPAKALIGIQTGTQEQTQDSLKYTLVVLDLKGKPIPRVEVQVNLLERKTYSYRRRITGGFYAYENTTEIKEGGRHCQGRTDHNGLLFCQGKSPFSGPVILQAEAVDDRNSPFAANQEIWVSGKGDQWDEARNDDRIDLIPDQRHWESGDQARFQVRMPFKQARVLITVEREGVLDAYVKNISRERPVVEIPVKKNYAPNVFVSALVVRGRDPQTRPTALFDPGKPAYKLGLTEIKVGWKPHELKVEVQADPKTYKPRETVTARILVKTAYGAIPPKGSEVAVAVVDEGLLELKPNESWKLLDAMMRRRGCEVETSTAQMMVIGKRHFGRKALPQGGGGGRQLTRELFDTLVYWKGSVSLDEKGQASVQFPLNDSLTSFKIVAVANAGQGLFGSGGTSIRTHQDLMILSGIPPLVREEDRFKAEFTARNTSNKDMEVVARLKVNPLSEKKELEPVRTAIRAGEAKEISWEITVPSGLENLDYEASIQQSGGPAFDRIKVSQKVARAVKIRPFQATLTRIKDSFSLPVERPFDAIPGQGGVNLLLRPKLSQGLTGVTAYMKEYPFSCLEQKISRAVVLQEKEGWRSLMSALPSYLDEDGLAKFFPVMRQGNDGLTAYLLSVSQEAGLEIPEPLREKMLKGLKDFVEGRVNRYSILPTADLSLRKLTALEALSRFGAAEKTLLGPITIEPNLWPTSALLDWINILSRVKDISDRTKKLKETEQILRSRMNLQGTVMNFSTEKSDNLWWLMTTPDTNAARALLTILPMDGWKDDQAKIAQGLLGRMKRGRWETTLANAWGLLAVKKLETLYDSVPVSGRTEATLDKKTELTDWSRNPAGQEVLFPWPPKKEVLQITHQGSGSPWATIRSLAAIPLQQPVSNGYAIRKTWIPVEQKNGTTWHKGDVVRVRLELESQADMTWVALSDPIPAGSMILGSGLGRDSSLLTEEELERGRVWETFRERSMEALRVYYEFVPKGKWTVEYTLRLNNGGTFYLPETRVEALYAPEMFGELPNRKMEIGT
jgi:uncharacterized protein YfaS (alpha-2-macroglobulin family)